MDTFEKVLPLLQVGYAYLLVADQNEQVLSISPALLERIKPGSLADSATATQRSKLQDFPLIDASLSSLLTPESLESARGAAGSLPKDRGSKVDLIFREVDSPPIPFWLAILKDGSEERNVFFGGATNPLYDWQSEERIKELNCLYRVAEHLEASDTEDDFFAKLPEIIVPGLLVPDKARVFIQYREKHYGVQPKTSRVLQKNIVANKAILGFISFGYDNNDIAILDEEHKLLDEILRMIRVVLERRWLSQKLISKKGEEEEHRQRISELEEQIQSGEETLKERKSKLETVTSYLKGSKREWEESIEVLRTLFQATPDHVALIDLKRDVVFTNHDEYKKEGKCFELFFNSDKPCRNCRLVQACSDKVPFTTTVQHGDTHYEVQSVPIFDSKHKVTGIIEYYRDATKEKALEQQLHQASKLTALGELVSGIGHEINNPNQFIKGNIGILKQVLTDVMPLVDKHYEENPDLKVANLPYEFIRDQIMVLVDDMESGSARIKGIVEGLRRFARKDEGLLIDTVDINNLINESIRLTDNQVRKFAIVHLDCDEDLPTFIGNAQKIEQVIINLIVNASQAMPKDKKGDIWVKSFKDGEHAVIQVKDNGRGMNEHTLKHIFDPFFTTKRAKGGTGIGLSISHGFIEEHGGAVNVDSEVGVGTTFVVRLPLVQETESGK